MVLIWIAKMVKRPREKPRAPYGFFTIYIDFQFDESLGDCNKISDIPCILGLLSCDSWPGGRMPSAFGDCPGGHVVGVLPGMLAILATRLRSGVVGVVEAPGLCNRPLDIQEL